MKLIAFAIALSLGIYSGTIETKILLASITIVNDDPFANNIRVIDKNNGDKELYKGKIAARGTKKITNCTKSSAGYCNISISVDGGSWTNYSLLKPGDKVKI